MIINRVIIEETPLYTLCGPQWDTTPGFFVLEPKLRGSKRIWTEKVQRHLEAFSDPLQNIGAEVHSPEITYQSEHRYSYNYQNGQVGVIPNKGIVEIAENHPNRNMVIQGLLKLFISSNSQGVIPSIKVTINN